MIAAELKKILIKGRGWLLILVALGLQVAMTFLRYDAAYLNFDMEEEKTYFLAYSARYGGKPDAGTLDEIERNIALWEEVQTRFLRIDEHFRAGAIPEAAWLVARRADRQARHRLTALRAMQQQALRVRAKQPQWILYTNGWSVLLNRSTPNLLLLLLIGCLVVPVICREYRCDMLPFLFTTRRGECLLPAKLAAVLLVAVGGTLLFALVDVLCIGLRYGLPMAECPVQSIQLMEACPWRLTVLQAYGMRVVMQCLGMIYFALLLFGLTRLLRHGLGSLIAASAVTLLPAWMLAGTTLPHRFPLPYGMLQAAGYLQGTFPYRMEMLTLTKHEIITAIICSLFLMLLLAFSCMGLLRLPKKTVLVLLLCLGLTGCGSSPSAEESCFNVIDWQKDVQSLHYRLFTDEDGRLQLENLQTGDIMPLIRDAFVAGRTIYYSSFYIDEPYFYRLETEYDDRENGGSVAIDRVIRTDGRDFSETVLYEEMLYGNRQENLLGLGDFLPPVKEQNDNAMRFAVWGNDIILESFSGLYLSHRGGKRQLLIDSAVEDWGLHGETLYYINEEYRLCSMTRKNHETRVITSFPIRKLSCTEDGIEVWGLQSDEKMVIGYPA